MSQASVATLCSFGVAAILTLGWCLLDSWNQETSSELFGLAALDSTEIDTSKATIRHFGAPLLLAFLQFLFMGLLFICAFYLFVPTARQEVAELRRTANWCTWATMVTTHVFSMFWLQALILPTSPMSLGLFAASRAFEVPIAAIIRIQVFDVKLRRQDLRTPVLMFAAAWLLFYSYAQLSHCLCIWSGFGVQLNGTPLLVVYGLVLAILPANYVAQESAMVHNNVKPLLLLAVMNLGASLLCLPLLPLAHFTGFEDLSAAWQMIRTHPQVYMLILWLCIQMTGTSACSAGLIYTLNSFWAVALRSLRVCMWWGRILIILWFSRGGMLSTTMPNESLWSFVMFCGVCFMVGGIYADTIPDGMVKLSRHDKQMHDSPQSV